MASHRQISKNVSDVNNAWARFHTLINSSIYGWAGNLYSYSSVFKRRK